MKTYLLTIIATVTLSLALNATAGNKPKKLKKPKGPKATVTFDGFAIPEIIFGSGNTNGFFTIYEKDGVQVALRAKRRFPTPNDTISYSNGDGTYSFEAGDACPGWGPTCLTTPVWSFDWSVNTDTTDSTGKVLSDYTYELGMDSDPGKKTKITAFDPISPSLVAPMFDDSIGTNGTYNGAGVEATDPVAYAALLDNNNVAQNSWNYEFFNNLGTTLEDFDPANAGSYVIYLRVIDPDKNRIVVEGKIEVLTEYP